VIDGLLTFVSLPCAAIFLGGGIRAGILAYRHRDQIHTTLERTSWFLRLFKRDGLGREAESERRILAIVILASGAGFFGVTGVVFALFGPNHVAGG
jgi:hypothetical protein